MEYENETTSGQLKISKYALQDGTSANPQTSKSQGFTNTYTTYDLTLEKQVTGNQGDRDKYFAFSITIGNIESSGTKFTVSTSNNRDNPTELVASSEVGDTGTYSATGTVYLKDNETITIYGLTEEMTYTIEETDYTTTDGYTTTNTDNTGVGADGKSTGVQTMGANDKTVTFINEKKGIIPTGILLETAPYIILAVVVIAGFVVLCATRRRRSR